MVNLARHLDVDPEATLRAANQKFERRFASIERALAARGKRPQDSTLAEMDALWDDAKAAEKPPEVDAGRLQILRIDKALRRRQRRCEHAALAHEGDDLGEPRHVELGLSGHDAPVRLEIKRERLPRDILGRAGDRHHRLDDLVAVGAGRG